MKNQATPQPTAPEATNQAEIRLPRGRQLSLGRPLVMGTLNVTPDSFSDGGRYNSRTAAIGHALEMEAEGADLIDIGGESTRPGAASVEAEEEIRRVLPVIEGIRKASDIAISVDTYKEATARAAIGAGADIVNDISALRFDPFMVELLAEKNVPVILMHMKGTPRDMQTNPHYDDCLTEIGEFFAERIAFATSHGIDESNIILDPGIGFGKRVEDNLAILAGLRRFRSFERPILVGASRKRFIEAMHPTGKRADQRLGGSIASVVAAVLNGADIVRVHDVDPTVEAIRIITAMGEAQ